MFPSPLDLGVFEWEWVQRVEAPGAGSLPSVPIQKFSSPRSCFITIITLPVYFLVTICTIFNDMFSLDFFIVVKYAHNIKFTNLTIFNCMVPVALGTITSVCNHHHHPLPEFRRHPKLPHGNSAHWTIALLLLASQCLGTTIQHSVSIILTVLGTSYKWNSTMFDFLWWTSFT